MARATVIALAVAAAGCGAELGPGELGIFRYAGNVRGAPPLDLLPPISDRQGNTYVLFGGPKRLEVELFIGYRGGTWDGGCSAYQQLSTQMVTYGAHGFVGRAEDRAWYWAGGALVGASAYSGGCGQVLPFDPNSGAKLSFVAALPFVREQPSKTELVAWVQAATDPRPFVALVDLDAEVFRSLVDIGPGSASDVHVLGVGADVDGGVVLMRYQSGGATRFEARFYDLDAGDTGRVALAGLDDLGDYDVAGYLQSGDGGLWAGVIDCHGQDACAARGSLLLFDHAGGKRVAPPFTPVGVHRWDDQLYVVGVSGDKPVIAPIDAAANVGAALTWQTSLATAAALGSSVEVVDDRTLPSHKVVWSDPRSAVGQFPFVHPHTPFRYSDEVSLWLVAGPGFKAGGEDRTAVAVAPVGIAYP